MGDSAATGRKLHAFDEDFPNGGLEDPQPGGEWDYNWNDEHETPRQSLRRFSGRRGALR